MDSLSKKKNKVENFKKTQAFANFYEKSLTFLKIRCFTSAKYSTEITDWSFQ